MRGSEVKEILKARGISQLKCARDTKLDYVTLNLALNEKGPFFPKYQKALGEYLGINIPVVDRRRKKSEDVCCVALQVKITAPMADLIEDIAKAEGLPKSEVVRTALKEGLGL